MSATVPISPKFQIVIPRDIRRALIEQGNVIDCIVNLPAKLFLNTQIPAALWFMSRNRGANNQSAGKFRNRSNEILFIDARNLGHLINRRTKELSHEDIKQITDTYHAWRNLPRHSVLDTESSKNQEALSEAQPNTYQDIAGFCASVSLERVKELDYVLTPGRYVGLPDDEDDLNFAERFNALKAEFEAQLVEEEKLNKAIAENLARVKL